MERSNRKTNIKIITTEPFPIGMAPSNRIMSYAKGFVENNCVVSVYCMKPTENQKEVFNKSSYGTIDGVYYKYSCGKNIVNRYYINRQIDNFKGVIKICIDILREKKTDKTDAIIYYSFSTSAALLLFFITRLKKIPFLKEVSEFPVVYTKNKFFLEKIIFNKIHYRLFDGLLVMTKRLIKYFVEEKNIKAPCFHVPMTVDFERFKDKRKENVKIRYIAYCGSLNNEKDGVDLLIDAFAAVAKDFPDINLYLIGASVSNKEHELYIKKVNQNQLTERVFFTGRVSKDIIPELLCNADILVLARPESIQAEGGFPTKLGEYLATGNPVVVTRVGEIPCYLTDEVNVFMAEPGSVDSLISKIKKILLDYTYASRIGENGKKIIIEHFNYRTQAENTLKFIKCFKNV